MHRSDAEGSIPRPVIPSLGERIPRRGNRCTRGLGRLLLRGSGWRIVGGLPNLPKFVVIVAPHTSNWDFYYAVCAMLALDIRTSWIGKHTLFRWPLGYVMRWLGGTGVHRDKSEGQVKEIVDQMNGREHFVWALSPEGTRRRTDRWKTGFYHVAHGAGVPIVLASLDYARKEIGLGPAFTPTGALEADLTTIREHYADKRARNPEQFRAR